MISRVREDCYRTDTVRLGFPTLPFVLSRFFHSAAFRCWFPLHPANVTDHMVFPSTTTDTHLPTTVQLLHHHHHHYHRHQPPTLPATSLPLHSNSSSPPSLLLKVFLFVSSESPCLLSLIALVFLPFSTSIAPSVLYFRR
ncbi:hypothetical protein BDV59DRAFT_37742 [Aspergillus ambiguus]|uniref:uncharacterized protein n=1 Tax=Aspergillus ambiguus TaxID=176160 RepID=UPI003CCC968B